MAISHRHQPLNYPEYISPLPADDLIKIGTIKQSLYNEGIDKVQKRIDELDKYGFDLVKEEDKKYFSQEMDKFIKSVNESAAKTDFSVLPNVRNILSIGRPIENDSNILNAVQSTAEYRRRQKELTTIPSKDRGPANDWAFMNDAESWLNDGKVGSKLATGKTYTPYVNAAKYVSEAVDKMKGNIEAEVIAENGFLKEKQVEEITQKRLKEWMQTSLPPQVINQVKLDAMYQAKDVSSEELKNYYFDKSYKAYKEVDEMMNMIEELPTLTKEQKDFYNKLTIQKQVLQDELYNIQESEQDARELWIDDAYNNFITGQAKSYAYRKEKESWKANQFDLNAQRASIQKDLVRLRREAQEQLYDYKLEKDKEYGILGKSSAGGGSKSGKPKEPSVTAQKRVTAIKNIKDQLNGYGTTSQDWVDITPFPNKGEEQKALNAAILKALTKKGVTLEGDFKPSFKGDIKVRKTSNGYEYMINEDENAVITQKEFEKELNEVYPYISGYTGEGTTSAVDSSSSSSSSSSSPYQVPGLLGSLLEGYKKMAAEENQSAEMRRNSDELTAEDIMDQYPEDEFGGLE
jgi:hypothetical protein